MRAYMFLCTGLFAAFIFFAFVPQKAEAGAVVPDSGSSDKAQAEALPGLPNYAQPEDAEEARRRMRRQQQPPAQPSGQTAATPSAAAAATPAAAGAYTQPQMPLPPTYAPGAPASSSQPVSQLPTPPTAYGLYDSPMSRGATNAFGLPAPGQMLPNQPGSMAAQPGGLGFQGIPPSPTAPMPAATSSGTIADQQQYGPHSPTGINQSATPRPSAAAQHQATTMPASGTKPFQDYHRKSPYSPYMSLFRYGDSARGIDNYYNYVKPALNQSRQNSRVNRNIANLQNSSRYQNMSISQINQQNQARQRPGNMIPGANVPQRMPATFMNTQQYYPGMR